jgi:hypothetical protein
MIYYSTWLKDQRFVCFGILLFEIGIVVAVVSLKEVLHRETSHVNVTILPILLYLW